MLNVLIKYISKINFLEKANWKWFFYKDFDKSMDLLNKVNEETTFIPIENLLFLSKLNKEKSLYIPLKD